MISPAKVFGSGTGEDLRALLTATGTILGLFAVGTAVQSVYVYRYATAGLGTADVWGRIAANILGVAVMLAGLWALRVHRAQTRLHAMATVASAGVVAGAVRTTAQIVFGAHGGIATSSRVADLVSSIVVSIAAGGIGVALMTSRRRLRIQVTAAAYSQMQITLALRALQDEEVRVRREVAEGLHGSLQQRLVLIVAHLDRILAHVEGGTVSGADVVLLREIRSRIEEVREGDVRETSRLLYPDGLEIGMVPALRSLLARIPADIATRLVVSDDVRGLDDPVSPRLTQSERLLAVRVVEEGLTNALRHGAARSLDVAVSLVDGALAVVVTDDGSGFDPSTAGPRSGIARLSDRLRLIGGGVDLTSTPGRGTRVEARVPVGALAGR